MSSSNTPSVSPSSLGFPSAAIEIQTRAANYAAVASLVIFLLDIIDNVVNDYNILKSGLNIPLFVYFVARIGAMGYLLGSVIFSSIPKGTCAIFITTLTACSSVAFACTALLFFLRLRAIYNQNRFIVAIFFVLWLAFPAISIYFLFIVNIRPDLTFKLFQFCPTDTFNTQQVVYFLHLATLPYDTLVFIAISWRLFQVSHSKPSGPQESMKRLFLGKYLLAITKSLYLDGQVYYLTTLIAGIVLIVFTFTPGIPAALPLLVVYPYAAVVNVMACRVYRRTRMGMIRESEISTSAIRQAQGIQVSHPIMFNNNPTTTDAAVPYHNSHHDTTGFMITQEGV